MADTINRDVGKHSRGPRLQRLRALHLMFDAMAGSPQYAQCYCAVEFQGDVYVKKADPAGRTEYLEENKNYDLDVSFTIASSEVKNTLVLFLDGWAEKRFSDHVWFGFYTPNNIGAERASETSKRLGIAWPKEPILKTLVAGQPAMPTTAPVTSIDSAVVKCISTIVLDEYRSQYKDPKNPGNIRLLESWSDEDWLKFLARIRWMFGEDDEVKVEAELVEKVRACRHYHQNLDGKEKLIISQALNLLDARQSLDDAVERCVAASEICLLFYEVAADRVRRPDPSWQQWASVEKTDTRNLGEKVAAAATGDIARRDLSRWTRAAGSGMAEQEEWQHDKAFLSMKYQVFDACEPVLADLIKLNGGRKLSASEFDNWVAILVDAAKARLKDRGGQYSYPIKSDDSIRCLVWMLVDSCFFAFDAGGVNA